MFLNQVSAAKPFIVKDLIGNQDKPVHVWLVAQKMKIEFDKIQEMTIEEFAEKHDLTMVIKERNGYCPFCASFKNAEIKEGPILMSESGYGDSTDKAIREYAKKISLKNLVIDAYGQYRKEIQVPRLT